LEIDGRRYSHILDPRTGIGLTDHSIVNVIAPEGITADSLTKVVSVLGPSKGLHLIEQTPNAAARIIRAPAGRIEIAESKRFARFYESGNRE
jgi:thiamine biosynthesis lipoprotein